MKTILFAMLITTTVHAETKYDMYYTDSSGARLSATDAILANVKGEQVYKCQAVEAKVSKSGTSISVKNVKKPKAQ